MKQPRQPDPSPPLGRRPPEYVVGQQLKERIRRIGVTTANPGQREPKNEPLGAELEAEP